MGYRYIAQIRTACQFISTSYKKNSSPITHQVFDIIGYTAPVMLIPKMILQETSNSKLKRDDILPDDLAKK